MADPKIISAVPATFKTTLAAPGAGERASQTVFERALQDLLNNDLYLKKSIPTGSNTGEGGGVSTIFTLLADGLVPHPGAENAGSHTFLKYDGTWSDPITVGAAGTIAVSDGADRYQPFAAARLGGAQNHWELWTTDTEGDSTVVSYDRTGSDIDMVFGASTIGWLELRARYLQFAGALGLKQHTDLALGASTAVYNPAGWAAAAVARLAPGSGDAAIDGFGSADDDEGFCVTKYLINVSDTGTITIAHNATGTTARALTPNGAPFALAPGQACMLVHDPASLGWRVFPLSGGGGGGGAGALADVLALGDTFGAFTLRQTTGDTRPDGGIEPGAENAARAGGWLFFEAQSSSVGAGGTLRAWAGDSSAPAFDGGDILISSGDGRRGGRIEIAAGASAPGETPANIELVPGTNGTLRGVVDADGTRIANIGTPEQDSDATTRAWVLANSATKEFVELVPVTVTFGMSPYTATSRRMMMLVETATSAVSVALPAPPQAGDRFLIKDASGSAETNNITINYSGYNLDGHANTTILDRNWQGIEIVWDSAAGQYRALSEFNGDNVATAFSSGIVPASGGGSTNFLRADMTWAAPPAGEGGSGGGGVPDDNSVTLAKLADIATDRLLGRDTAGLGDPELISVGGGLEFTGTGAIRRGALTGDITSAAGSNATALADGAVTAAKILDNAVGTTKIADDAVTFAKLQTITTDRLLGRDTAATGNVEEIAVGGGLEFDGSGTLRRSAFTGDVTAAAGSTVLALGNSAVATNHLQGGAVTFAKLQNVATQVILGRATAGTGSPEAMTLGAGLTFSGGALDRSALTGDVAVALGSTTATIANNAINDAKLRDSAACSVIGRSPNTTGDPADIAAAADNRVLKRAGGFLLFDQIATNDLANSVVTYAKIQNVTAQRLLGRYGAGVDGSLEEIPLGAGLTMNEGQLVFTGEISENTPLAFYRADLRHESTIYRAAGELQITGGDAQDATDADGTSIRISPGAGNGVGARGTIIADGARITSVGAPQAADDVATKAYADSLRPTFTAAGQVPVYNGTTLVAVGVKTAFLTDASVTLAPAGTSRYVLNIPLTAHRTITLDSTGMAALLDSGDGWTVTFERQQTSDFNLIIVWAGVTLCTLPANAPHKYSVTIGYAGTNFYKVATGALV